MRLFLLHLVLHALLWLPATAQVTDEVVVLPSAARTASTNSDELTNHGQRGIALYIDVTAVSSGSISTVAIQAPNPSGTWTTLYSFGTLSIGSTGTHALCVYPGAASAASWKSAPLQGPLPRRFRVAVTNADSNSITYSVRADLLP